MNNLQEDKILSYCDIVIIRKSLISSYSKSLIEKHSLFLELTKVQDEMLSNRFKQLEIECNEYRVLLDKIQNYYEGK